MRIRELIVESKLVLLENLTKGSQNILRNINLVSGIADQLRYDHTVPHQLSKKFQKMQDNEVAEWFLNELDRMEQEGANGVSYSRDGKLNMWIALNYSSGADVWEDIEGELQDTLADYIALRNRNLLDERHADIQKFKGVKALHRYLVTHYHGALADLRDTLAKSALIKNPRSVLIADEPEYKIYLLQNRAAAIIHGKGATFCTANSQSDANWKSYSSRGPIFGLIPKGSMVKGPAGMFRVDPNAGMVPEKFQFDAPSHSFKDYLDHQCKPITIKERFPYLLDDLIKGMEANRAAIETPSEDPKNPILTYDVTKAIQDLKSKLAEFWTDKKRPAPMSEEDQATIAWFEEHFQPGDMLVMTNPRATPRVEFVGITQEGYELRKPNDPDIYIMPKLRIAKRNKEAWELRNNPEAAAQGEPEGEEPNL